MVHHLFELDQRVAVVTGGGRGLGRTLAEGLSKAGAIVVVCDIDETAARQTAQVLGGEALGLVADIAKEQDLERLYATVEARFGRVDILINNAAIDIIEPALELAPDKWRRVIDVNLTGAFMCAQLAGRMMCKRGRGSIVNMTSIAAMSGIQRLAAYSAAKAGLGQVTRVLAVEFAASNVRVNAIAPGYLENTMVGAEQEHADAAKEAQIRTFTPLGRRARLDELVGPALFLASDASSYVTGATLAVDGGYTAI